MTVIKITVIHSKGYNQITMGIETLRNIVIITTDIFAVHAIFFWKKPFLFLIRSLRYSGYLTNISCVCQVAKYLRDQTTFIF